MTNTEGRVEGNILWRAEDKIASLHGGVIIAEYPEELPRFLSKIG